MYCNIFRFDLPFPSTLSSQKWSTRFVDFSPDPAEYNYDACPSLAHTFPAPDQIFFAPQLRHKTPPREKKGTAARGYICVFLWSRSLTPFWLFPKPAKKNISPELDFDQKIGDMRERCAPPPVSTSRARVLAFTLGTPIAPTPEQRLFAHHNDVICEGDVWVRKEEAWLYIDAEHHLIAIISYFLE